MGRWDVEAQLVLVEGKPCVQLAQEPAINLIQRLQTLRNNAARRSSIFCEPFLFLILIFHAVKSELVTAQGAAVV